MTVDKSALLILFLIGFLYFLVSLMGCDSSIEDSPAPGILRVTLVSDQADTVIVIVTDTLTVSDEDVFLISVFQGKVFQDSTYGVIYPSLDSYQQKEFFYNLIERENDQYQRFTIFESYLPPAAYNEIEFGIDSRYLKLLTISRIDVITPPNYFIKLPANFEIRSDGVTEVNLMISPFECIVRYRDTYLFEPVMEVIGVNYYY